MHRIKVKNWGNTLTDTPSFVVSAITGDTSAGLAEAENAGIEQCQALEPSSVPNTSPVNLFHIGGRQAEITNAEAYGKGPHIRNCYVDCGQVEDFLDLDIRALSVGWCKGRTHSRRLGRLRRLPVAKSTPKAPQIGNETLNKQSSLAEKCQKSHPTADRIRVN